MTTFNWLEELLLSVKMLWACYEEQYSWKQWQPTNLMDTEQWEDKEINIWVSWTIRHNWDKTWSQTGDLWLGTCEKSNDDSMPISMAHENDGGSGDGDDNDHGGVESEWNDQCLTTAKYLSMWRTDYWPTWHTDTLAKNPSLHSQTLDVPTPHSALSTHWP